MMRKRMISPEIWESQDFSRLNNFEKIVFISLFCHADDEGRGRAEPTYITSATFPYDKTIRVSDIQNALSKIAQVMSVQLYSVGGNDYYFMKSWEKWQKVDKPSKSMLPAPPDVGEGGELPNCEKPIVNLTKFVPNRIEKNRNIYVFVLEDCLGKLCKAYRSTRANRTESRASYMALLNNSKRFKGAKTKVGFNHVQIGLAAKEYIRECDEKCLENKYVQLLSVFLNGRVADYVEKTRQAYETAMKAKYGEEWVNVEFVYE